MSWDWNTNLEGVNIADDKAIVDCDGEIPGIWGEAARSCQLVRICELHYLQDLWRSSPAGREIGH